MKSYILDTHIFLNAYIKPEKLKGEVLKIFENDNHKFISAISLIEIALIVESKPKEFKIKIPLSEYINNALNSLQVKVLEITTEHSQRFYELNLLDNHKDQYDRIIIAQAMSTGYTVLSDDRKFPLYPIKLISN